jgi:hypothetical protein
MQMLQHDCQACGGINAAHQRMPLQVERRQVKNVRAAIDDVPRLVSIVPCVQARELLTDCVNTSGGNV